MKVAALFSGGKDSLYAVYLVEMQGVTINHLVTILPTPPWPSPHAQNIDALKTLSASMGKKIEIIDFQRETSFLEVLENLEIGALVAGGCVC